MDYDIKWRYYALYDNGTQAELQIAPEFFKDELEELLFKYTSQTLKEAGDNDIVKVSLKKFEAPMWYNVAPKKKE